MFMQLCPAIKLHQPSCNNLASFCPFCLFPLTSSEYERSLRWVSPSPGSKGEATRQKGAPNLEFYLPATVIGSKPRSFHGSAEGPVIWGAHRGSQRRPVPREEVLTVIGCSTNSDRPQGTDPPHRACQLFRQRGAIVERSTGSVLLKAFLLCLCVLFFWVGRAELQVCVQEGVLRGII